MDARVTRAVIALALTIVFPLQVGAAPRFSGWSEPVNLGCEVNSSFNDRAPALSKKGLSLYFGSDRPGGVGGSPTSRLHSTLASRARRPGRCSASYHPSRLSPCSAGAS